MAFVEKSGRGFVVKQGNTGKTLSRHSSREEANDRVAELHSENNPAAANRGSRAQRAHKSDKPRKQAMGRKKSSASRSAKNARTHKRKR